jgi:hypothetical protein
MGVLSLKMTQDDMTLKIVQEGKCEIYKEIFFERAIAARFPARIQARSLRERPAFSKCFVHKNGRRARLREGRAPKPNSTSQMKTPRREKRFTPKQNRHPRFPRMPIVEDLCDGNNARTPASC